MRMSINLASQPPFCTWSLDAPTHCHLSWRSLVHPVLTFPAVWSFLSHQLILCSFRTTAVGLWPCNRHEYIRELAVRWTYPGMETRLWNVRLRRHSWANHTCWVPGVPGRRQNSQLFSFLFLLSSLLPSPPFFKPTVLLSPYSTDLQPY